MGFLFRESSGALHEVGVQWTQKYLSDQTHLIFILKAVATATIKCMCAFLTMNFCMWVAQDVTIEMCTESIFLKETQSRYRHYL